MWHGHSAGVVVKILLIVGIMLSSVAAAIMAVVAARAPEPALLNKYIVYGLASAGLYELCLIVAVVVVWRKRPRAAPPPEMSVEELAHLEAERRLAEDDRRLYAAIANEARELATKIPHHLATQMRMEQRRFEDDPLRAGKRKRKIRWLRFEVALCTKTEIWYKVDGRPERMPSGVSFYDLIGPSQRERVLFNLEHGINRPCRWHTDNFYNVFLRVNLRNAVMGIPRLVEWGRVVHLLPASNRHAVAVGVNEYSKLIYADFRNWPHAVIAGATQQGKSTWLVQAIVTLLQRNTPSQLQFIFVDLKDGLEFERFSTVPHCRQFISEPADVPAALAALYEEYERRVRVYRERGVQNIRGYNAIADAGDKHAYILFIVDELADVMFEESAIKTAAIGWSVKLARKARAAGIHLWYCTQIIEAKILPLQIRGNFPARIAFNMAGFDESRLMVGNGMAHGLEVPGRAVYQFAADHKIVQSPICGSGEVSNTIAQLTAPPEEMPERAHFTEMDLFRIARDNYRGECGWRNLWADSEGNFSADAVKTTLKKYTYQPETMGPVFELDGVRYILVLAIKRSGPRRPRKLVDVSDVKQMPRTLENATSMAWDAAWDRQYTDGESEPDMAVVADTPPHDITEMGSWDAPPSDDLTYEENNG